MLQPTGRIVPLRLVALFVHYSFEFWGCLVTKGSFDEKEIKVRYALGMGRNALKPPRSTRLFCRQV